MIGIPKIQCWRPQIWTITLAFSISHFLADSLFAQQSTDNEPVDFARQILPILSDKCFVCHGPDGQDKDVLRLDSFEHATKDLGGYFAINEKTPADSEILVRVNSTDDPMPPEDSGKKLTSSERKLISRWIRQGGAYTKHWAFVPPTKKTTDPFPLGSEIIDKYVGEVLRENGIDFAPRADRPTLARRAALVLTGLPPEPAALNEFINNPRRDAYEQFVDRLLGSPRFGEHQARYWLDAVRYGDTHGLHLDNRRGIYPYRDWVVRAFNDNLPLDKFITWQLAGDLLPQPTLQQRIATGFVRLNPSTAEGGVIPAEFQAKNNFDRTETLGTVFLGMSLICARCHTHKYDPVTQLDYYRLFAFFNSTAEPALDGNSYQYGPVVRVPKNQAAWKQWKRLEAERDELVTSAIAKIEFELKPSKELLEAQENSDATRLLAILADPNGPFAISKIHQQATELARRISKAKKDFTTSLVANELPQPRATRLLERGEYNLPTGDPLQPGVLSGIGELPEDAPRNRLGLARWLTSPKHPLVSRVLINRVWQRTFGYGLVRTPEDFGLQGAQPTHPDLLDWLAVELQESGWDLKYMLRGMVTSRTFCQESAWRTDIDDPENRWLARGPRFRLDSEVLRDIALWASGLLDPAMGGEGVKPYQPSGMWLAMAHPASNTKTYERDIGQKLYRRSLYVYWKRTSPHPMMTLFDAPSRESSCVIRSRTNTPLQSLGLFNETQRIEMSRMFAERLLREQPDDASRLDRLFRLIACRKPTDSERVVCNKLLTSMHKRFRNDLNAANELLSTGDAPRFHPLDPAQHAAWTQVVVTVLASDIGIMLY